MGDRQLKRIRQTEDAPVPDRLGGDLIFPKKLTDQRCVMGANGHRCPGLLWRFVGLNLYVCEKCGENAWQT